MSGPQQEGSTYQSAWYLATLSAVTFLSSPTEGSLSLFPLLSPSLRHHRQRMHVAACSARPHPCATYPGTVRLLRGPPGTTRPPFLLQRSTLRSLLQTPTGNVPSTLRWLKTPMYQVFSCKPGLRPSPPVIAANISRLGNRPLCYRATAPAKKSLRSLRLRMVVAGVQTPK